MAGKIAVFNPNVGIVDRLQIGHSVGDEVPFIDVYSESSTKLYPLGTRFEIGDRVYRYTLNGAVALAAGKLVQKPVIETNGDHTDMAVDTPAIGAESMEVTNGANTAIVVDEFANGYLHVNDDTGEGHAYQIRKNDAIATSAAGTIFLWDPVLIALVANSTVTLTGPKYYKVIVHPSPPTAQLVGVPNLAVTADNYFWCQTKGPCAVLGHGTLIELDLVYAARHSTPVDGSVEAGVLTDGTPNTELGQPPVGVCLHVNITVEYSLIDLNLE